MCATICVCCSVLHCIACVLQRMHAAMHMCCDARVLQCMCAAKHVHCNACVLQCMCTDNIYHSVSLSLF